MEWLDCRAGAGGVSDCAAPTPRDMADFTARCGGGSDVAVFAALQSGETTARAGSALPPVLMSVRALGIELDDCAACAVADGAFLCCCCARARGGCGGAAAAAQTAALRIDCARFLAAPPLGDLCEQPAAGAARRAIIGPTNVLMADRCRAATDLVSGEQAIFWLPYS